MNDSQFVQLMEAIGASTRYKESVDVGYIERVPESGLGAFWASMGSPVAGTIGGAQVSPPGIRAQYCLDRAGFIQGFAGGVSSLGALIPAGADFCAASAADKLFQAAANEDELLVTSVAGGLATADVSMETSNLSKLPPDALPALMALLRDDVVIAPVYRVGTALTTVADRQAALVGWATDVLDVPGIVSEGLRTSGFELRLTHTNPGRPPLSLFHTAMRSTGDFTRTMRIAIDGQWAITLIGSPPSGAISSFSQGVLLGSGLLVVAVSLFALVWVLGRSRERALGLVDQKTAELVHQALHDGLTGLPNRVLIVDRAEQMLARAARQHLQVGALFLDLDNFKAINDGLGHAAGDRILQLVATRLNSALRASDTIGRLGGDEFVILVEGALDMGPELVATRLTEVLRQPFLLDEASVPLNVSASIGIAVGARETAERLLRDADVALYEAKAAGKNCYRIFRTEMQHAVSDRLELEMDLHLALNNEEFFVVYQPIFDLRSEDVTAVEALLRWRHPTRGIVAPTTFIPIAEETGLIVPIGRWVLNQVCLQGETWRGRGSTVAVSVNVSGRQLETDEFATHVQEALDNSGLDPGLLTLEITESTLMRDTGATIRRLRHLKDLGVRLAIDDFGTGYSSLAYLREFPVDALKIDRSFIAGIAESTESGALIHTLIQLGKTLGLETLAEGIEERAQLVRLQRERCDTGQGFLLARPLEVDEMEEFLGVRGTAATSGFASHGWRLPARG
ncbi:MAG TPA: EAL domain-containing protein [Acidimicrobiales bacterium]|nr:EAL domain-containing protein [Acidimicrobiales bacterium]